MASKNWLHYNPSFLEKNEVEYDLNIRGIIGLSSRRAESSALRNFLINKCNGEYVLPSKNSRDSKTQIQVLLNQSR